MANLEGFEIELRLDCTVKVGEWDFVKPGVSGKMKYDTIPDEKTIRRAIDFMTSEVLEPTLEDVIVEVQKKIKSSRQP